MKEIITGIVLIVLVFFVLNPFHSYMPDPVAMMALFLSVVVFGFFASFVLRENPRDERENLHRMFAGRTAFLAGSFVLMLGILLQALHHAIDAWLVYAFAAMIAGKIIGLLWSSARR